MLTFITMLYAAGWVLTVVAVVVAAWVTRRAVNSIDRDRQSVLDQLKLDMDAAASDEKRQEILDQKFDRLRAKLVPPGSAMGAGNVVQASQFTMLRVARANLPSAIIVLAGGLASTFASILSLYA